MIMNKAMWAAWAGTFERARQVLQDNRTTIALFKGALPVDADFDNGVYPSVTRLSDRLVHFTGQTFRLEVTETAAVFDLLTFPSTNPVNAAISGEATWATLWTPSAGNFWTQVDFSLPGGGGNIIVDKTTMVQGEPVTLMSFSIKTLRG